METKTCSLCKETLPLESFYSVNKSARNNRPARVEVLSQCKKCWCASTQRSAARRKAKDPEAWRQKANEKQTRMVRNRQEFIQSLKAKPCLDCGGTFHHSAMQFDHMPGHEKAGSISYLGRFSSKEKILEEIAKCELVCANCHSVRTWNRAH